MNRRPSEERKHRKHGSGRDRSRSRSRSPRDEVPKLENISLDAKNRLKRVGSQIKLSTQQNRTVSPPQRPKLSVATAFNQDSDDEPEEMPPEAKMRMRNIGRDTPTSSGPNSFGKTKQGFSDAMKVFEKNMRQAMETVSQKVQKSSNYDEGPKIFPENNSKVSGYTSD